MQPILLYIIQAIDDISVTPVDPDFDADVVFLIDSAWPVGMQNFKAQKDFVKSFSKALSLKHGKARGAVISYSTNPQVHFQFNEYKTSKEFEKLVDSVPFLGQYRRMDRAIQEAGKVLSGSRKNVPKVVILMTAGRDLPGRQDLDQAVEILKRLGAKLFIVGIGTGPDYRDLRSAVEEKDDLIQIGYFSQLPQAVGPAAKHVISRADDISVTPVDPNFDADVVFLVDSAWSVGRQNFKDQKDFVKSFSRALSLKPGKARGAVISYSTNPRVHFQFNDYKTSKEFEKLVDSAPFIGQYRRMDRAIQEAGKVLNGARKNVPKVVILITAGRDLPGGQDLDQAVEILTRLGAKLFIVGIGRGPDYGDLSSAVEEKDDLIQISDFSKLPQAVVPAAKHVSSRADYVMKELGVDVVFIIDASTTIDDGDFERAKSFVTKLATTLNLSTRHTRAAFVTYSSFPKIVVPMDRYNTISSFKRMARDAALHRDRTLARIDLAVEVGNRQLRAPGKNRNKVALLIISEQEDSGTKPLRSVVQPLRDIGTDVYVIAIGSNPNIENLLPLVLDHANIFKVRSYQDLPGRLYQIADVIAKSSGTREFLPKEFEAEVVFAIDSSIKISPVDFNNEKDFVSTIAKLMNLNEQKVRAGVIIYGNYPERTIGIGSYDSVRDFESKLAKATPIGGIARVSKALESSVDLLHNSRPAVPRFIILLTAEEKISEPALRKKVLQSLKRSGARILVVAVGNMNSTKDLQKLVSKPEDIFTVPRFEQLVGFTNWIVIAMSKMTFLPEKADFTADIIFLADTSSSVSQEEFEAQKDIIITLSGLLNTYPGKSKVSYITYSNRPIVNFRLGGYTDQLDLKKRIKESLLTGGSRRMDKALHEALGLFKERPRHVPKIVILMTTGTQTSEKDSQSLDKKAAEMLSIGAKIYAIAFGKRPDSRELSRAVQKSEDVLRLYSVEDAVSQMKSVAIKIIKDQSLIQRPIEAEIIFLVDSSASVNIGEFRSALHCTKSLANHLKLFSGKSRPFFISFGSYPIVANEYKTQKEFNNSLDRARHIRGKRRIDLALERALQMVKGTKPDIARILVLLTTGSSSPDSEDFESTVKQLRNLGMKLFVFIIGENTDGKELLRIVEKPDDFIKMPSFKALLDNVKDASENITKSTMDPMKLSADIIFATDSSATVSRQDYEKQKEFLKGLARQLNVSPGKSRASMITYGKNTRIENKFGEYKTSSEFEQIVNEALYMGGSRRIDRALATIDDAMRYSSLRARKIVVLFISGQEDISSQLLGTTVKKLQDQRVKIFAVPFGKKYDLKGLQAIVEERQNIFRIQPLNDLKNWIVPTSRIIAARLRRSEPLDLSADIIFMIDTSVDVNENNVNIQKQFAKSLSELFDIASDKTRVGLVVYGNQGVAYIKLDIARSPLELASFIDKVPTVGGERRMDNALESAALLFTGSRPKVSKIALLLTSGSQSPKASNQDLNSAAQVLRKMGVRTFVIAIGNKVKSQELKTVTSNVKDVLKVLSFGGLPLFVSPVFRIIHDAYGNIAQAKANYDIVFVIDSSGSSDSRHVQEQKEIVKKVAQHFITGSVRPRFALVNYGSVAHLKLRFKTFIKFHEFKSRVDQLNYIGGERRLDRALNTVVRLVGEANSDAYKVVILFVTGTQSSKTNYWQLKYASRMLHNIGAKAYVISSAHKNGTSELRLLTDRDNDILTVPSLDNSKDISRRAVNLVDIGSGRIEPSLLAADIMFLADSSSDVSMPNFSLQKDFIKNFARKLGISQGRLRVGLLSYGSSTLEVIDLDSYGVVNSFNIKVDNASYVGGRRNIHNALRSAKQVLDSSSARDIKIVFLLTAGQQFSDDTKRQIFGAANSLRLSGILTYVIGIGEDIQIKDLLPLVDRPEDAMILKAFNDLPSFADDSLARITSGVSSRVRYKADIVFIVDTSNEVTRESFLAFKQLAKALRRYLNTSPKTSRAAILFFGSYVNTVLRLRDDQSIASFESAIDSAAAIGGQRRMDLALSDGAHLFLDARSDVPRIAFILTTGRQDQKPGARSLLQIGRRQLKDMDAWTYVIAIGESSSDDLAQLKQIASTPNDVFFLTLNGMLSKVSLITQHAKATATKGEKLYSLPPSDLIFMIDSSDEVTSYSYKRQKDIVKFIFGHFDIGASKTRIAVGAYSDLGGPVVSFGSFNNIIDIHRGIDSIPYFAGKRSLDKAVQDAEKLLSTSRKQAKKFVFILVTGLHQPAFGALPLSTVGQNLKEKAQVFVIGIGSRPDINELRQLTLHEGNIYIIPSSGNLKPELQFMLKQVTFSSVSEIQRNDMKNDLVFVVDSSDSVGKPNFLKSKDFVQAFARTLNIAAEKTHVAVITFGDTTDLSIRFGEYTSTQAFLPAVDSVAYIGGTKRLDKALILSARILQKSRPSSNKIAIIISDGKQISGREIEPLDLAAQPLHGLGAKVYVIGTGGDVNLSQLQKITPKPGNIFVTKSYDDLLKQIFFVLWEMAIAPTETGPPGYVADILFLMDASDRITALEFERQKDFFKDISRRLNVSPFGTRAGFITYNDNSYLAINFNSYNQTSDFYTLLSDVKKLGGGRRLDKALQMAGQTFTDIRRNAAKVIVILARGKPITDSDSIPLVKVMKPLKNQGIVINVLAIGQDLDVFELTTIAQRPENILFANNLDELQAQINRIWKHIVGTTVVTCNQTLDVGIVMDSSGSLGREHYSKQLDFIKSIIRELVIASPRSRLGIVPFSDFAEVAIDFNNFQTMSSSELDASIDGLPYEQGRTRIDRALDVASKGLFTNKRVGVPQVLLLITDGRQSKDPGYIPIAQSMIPIRLKGIKTIAVGIGKDIDLEELKQITGDNKNVFIVGAFDELEGIVRGLVALSCSV